MRVVSYNIHGGRPDQGNGRADAAAVAEVLHSLQPDVAALQEVHRRLPPPGAWQDQPRILSRALDLDVTFGPTVGLLGAGYGNAILARERPREIRNLRLPGSGEPRCLLQALLSVGESEFWLWNTHLALDPQARLRQCEYLAEQRRIEPRPVLLAGDLNAVPEGPELTLLREAGFHPLGRPELASFPAHAPQLRLDHLLASEHWESFGGGVGTGAASDHLPVWADLRLARISD